MSRIKRLPPTQGASAYDPNRRRVLLAANASPYQQAHEMAHRAQHATETLAWRCHRRMMHAPYLCRFTRLWLEWEAARMALAGMRGSRTWTKAAQSEARRELFGYLGSLVW